MKKIITSFFLLFIVSFADGQNPSASTLLNNLYLKSLKAKDYSASAHIKVDLPFLKMLPINAKVYFKQKDKFKVDSKSIAILPRQSFDQLTSMLKDTLAYTAMVQTTENIGAVQTTVVSVIPLSDTSDLILGRIWIDQKNNLVLKSQLTTKSNGTILTEYYYKDQIAYGLPEKMIFTVDVKKFKVPKSVTIDINNTKPQKESKEKQGKIEITLSDYKINQGLSDEIFKK